MKWLPFVLLLLLLVACEDVPEEEEELVHRVNLEMAELSTGPYSPGGLLKYNYTLLNVGREDVFDVAVETRIRQQSTGKIIKRDAAIVGMEGLLAYKEDGLSIPQDATQGTYELVVAITYDDGSDGASFDFAVEVNAPEPEPEPKEPKKTEETDVEPTVEVVQEPEPTPKPTGTVVRVVINNYAYHPQDVNISVGDTVEWYNNDSVPHSATGPGFDSGPIARGDTYQHTFTDAVIKPYASTYTEGPYGRVVVR